MTPADFKSHYENIHVPLMKSLMGDNFPICHARRYLTEALQPVSSGPLVGVDCITELTWRDKEHFQNFMAASSEASVAEKVAADCSMFMDMTKETVSTVVDEYRATTA